MGIEGMDVLSLLFTGHRRPRMGQISSPRGLSSTSEMNVCPVLLDGAEFSAACLYIVFRIHMEALDGY